MQHYYGSLRPTEEQRQELARWAEASNSSPSQSLRAKLILALADGKSYSQIEVELHTSRPTIARWKARFQDAGLSGLQPRRRGGRPKTSPEVQELILLRAQQTPEDGSAHWSCRRMAAALGISKSTVQRVWSQAKLCPGRPSQAHSECGEALLTVSMERALIIEPCQ